MLSIFNLYLARRYIFWFFALVLIVGCVIGLVENIELLRKTMSKPDVTFSSIMQLTVLKIPGHIQSFFPFLCMLSAQITLWRLNNDQEIVAIRSVGMSVFQIISGLLVCVFMLGIFQLFVLNPIAAIMHKRSINIEKILFKNKADDSQLFISDGEIWLREKIDETSRHIHVEKYNIEQNIFQNIHIFEIDQQGLLIKRLIAEKGTLKDKAWFFEHVQSYSKNQEEGIYQNLSIPTDLSIQQIQESNAPPETLSIFSLFDFIKNLSKSGLSSLKYELYAYSLIAKLPLSMALIVLAAVFCLHPTRYKKTGILILLGVLTGFSLHFITDVIHALGLAQKIPLLLAVFAPTLITSFLSFGLILHIEQD